MARTEPVCACGQFCCYPLSSADDKDLRDVAGFEPVDPSGYGLAEYLRGYAMADEDRGLMRTYLVRDSDTDELAGYFSLKAGMVSLGETPGDVRAEFDTVPGIELANYAVDGRYRAAHPGSRGCGRVIFQRLVVELARRAAGIVGACLLYIFSLPEERVMGNYGSYGFLRLPPEEEDLLHARLKPRYDRGCVFMYMML